MAVRQGTISFSHFWRGSPAKMTIGNQLITLLPGLRIEITIENDEESRQALVEYLSDLKPELDNA